MAQPVKIAIATHIILRDKDDNICLLKRENTGFCDDQWSLPAGRVDENESITVATVRETFEEIGVTIKEENLSKPLIMYHSDQRGQRMYFFYTTHIWTGNPINKEPEKCSAIVWHPINMLDSLDIVPHVRQAIKETLLTKTHFIEYGFTQK
jgi:ADP-ribose pyrophosphatase YjhB (NUDIX family)